MIRKCLYVLIFLSFVFNIFSYNHIEANISEIEHEPLLLCSLDKDVIILEKRVQDLETEIEITFLEIFYNEYRLIAESITDSCRLTQEENSIRAINLDLREHSSLTSSEINYLLDNTNLSDLGEAFVQAELDYNVNAFFLMSLAIHESGWGRSQIAKIKNNLFGFGAFDTSPFESAVTFSSKSEGIDKVARHLKENYLCSSGRFFGGGYNLSHINKRYASDEKWAIKIANTMDRLNNRLQK